LVVDNAWTQCGASAEIVSRVAETLGGEVRMRRLGFAPVTCPTSPPLEEQFYPNAPTIAKAANDLVCGSPQGWCPTVPHDFEAAEAEFKGPF
jgi:pyruvate dehydrogenase E1 component beta subunit